MRLLLYVAAPYTRPDPVWNTSRAIRCATAIYDDGYWVPIVPHLSLVWHLIEPRPIEHWYDYDLCILAHCQALVRLPGESTGADRETAWANQHGLRILRFEELPRPAQRAWVDG